MTNATNRAFPWPYRVDGPYTWWTTAKEGSMRVVETHSYACKTCPYQDTITFSPPDDLLYRICPRCKSQMMLLARSFPDRMP